MAILPPAVWCSEITFDSLPAGNVPDGFGSSSHLTASYSTVNGSGSVDSNNMGVYYGYGALQMAAYPSQNGDYGEITLAPAPGYQVTLSSFVMAGYYTNVSGQTVQILGANGNPVLDYSPATLMGATKQDSTMFTSDLTSTGPLTIKIGPSWDDGIDYISYSTAPISPVTHTITADGIVTYYPFQNSNYTTGLFASGIGPPVMGSQWSWPLMDFDLSGLAGETVNSDGVLRLNLDSLSLGTTQMQTTLQVAPLVEAYDHTTGATPGWGDTTFGAAHFVFYQNADGSTPAGQYADFDIPEATLQSWMDSPGTNYGLVLQQEQTTVNAGTSVIDWGSPLIGVSVL
jgi:hypothetical protein